MSSTTRYKPKLDYVTIHKKQPRFFKETFFWFFLSNESFISKTLDEGHVNINKFPASKVRQMAKKLEGSQATAKHMKTSN